MKMDHSGIWKWVLYKDKMGLSLIGLYNIWCILVSCPYRPQILIFSKQRKKCCCNCHCKSPINIEFCMFSRQKGLCCILYMLRMLEKPFILLHFNFRTTRSYAEDYINWWNFITASCCIQRIRRHYTFPNPGRSGHQYFR